MEEQITIDLELLLILNKHNLTIEEYMVLYCKYHSYNWLSRYRVAEKTYNKLINDEWLGRTRTLLNKHKEKFLYLTEGELPVKKSFTEEDLDKVWEAFPTTDKCGIHPKTRTLRSNKKDCKIAIGNILSEGEFTATQLIGAINSEVQARTSKSIRENKLTFMKNFKSWLTARDFEGWMDNDEQNDTTNNSAVGELD
tara:strand:- start:929 stop:1516 length:588 start_codon:yes stop_codon:yes gene_type:complete